MKTKSFLLFFIASFFSCTIYLQDEDYRFFPARREIAVVTNSQYISHTSSEVIYEMEVVLLPYFEGDANDDYIYLPQEDFAFENPNTAQIIDFDTVKITAPAGNLSVACLIDQSGSYEETDYYNSRSQVINKFFQDNSPPDNFLVGGFSRGGLLREDPVELFKDNFINDWQAPQEYLFGLAKRTSGTSSLYDALANTLTKFNSPGVNQRKELIVLAHSQDAGSSVSISAVIQQAKAYGVRIHAIELGNELNGVLAPFSQQTGGIHAYCPTIEESATMFNHFRRLLKGSWKVYRIRARYQPGSGVVQSGFDFTQMMKINAAEFDFQYNPVYVSIKVP